ncbi:MAG: hypothetical protein AAF985_13020, partial [Bacteroidota bacterium]
KLVKSKDLERLAHQFVQANLDLGQSITDLPEHLTTIAKVVRFRKRMKKGGARNFFYTEKIERLKEVIEAFRILEATEEVVIMEKYLLDANNYQNDHLKKKAARKLAKQFTKNEKMNEFLLSYIAIHRNVILDEFTHCSMTKSIRL